MTVLQIRGHLSVLAGDGWRAEVETFGGWKAIDGWTPYGLTEGHGVQFYFDIDESNIRESPNDKLAHLVPSDQCITGVWPVRFVQIGGSNWGEVESV